MFDWPEIRTRCSILETDDILVLDKPAGISVIGERHETDLMQLARTAGEWLMPAHRIDKVTSGVVLLAKNMDTHAALARQFNARSVHKLYLALTESAAVVPQGIIDLPLSVGRKSRVRVAAQRDHITLDKATNRWSVPESDVFSHVPTYPSISTFSKVWESPTHTLLLVRPITGRRHQIRVHLAWIGYPIAGDPLFHKGGKISPLRTCLHAWRLAFDEDWRVGERRLVTATPGADFWGPITETSVHLAPTEIMESVRHHTENLPRVDPT